MRKRILSNALGLTVAVILMMGSRGAWAVPGAGGGGDKVSPFFSNPEPVLANVVDARGQMRYVQITLIVHVKDIERDMPKVKELWPEIANELVFMIGDYRAESLRDVATIDKLREKIKTIIANFFKKYYELDDSIEDVFFQDLVYQ